MSKLVKQIGSDAYFGERVYFGLQLGHLPRVELAQDVPPVVVCWVEAWPVVEEEVGGRGPGCRGPVSHHAEHVFQQVILL